MAWYKTIIEFSANSDMYQKIIEGLNRIDTKCIKSWTGVNREGKVYLINTPLGGYMLETEKKHSESPPFMDKVDFTLLSTARVSINNAIRRLEKIIRDNGIDPIHHNTRRVSS
mgnify:CR=1 FL=1